MSDGQCVEGVWYGVDWGSGAGRSGAENLAVGKGREPQAVTRESCTKATRQAQHLPPLPLLVFLFCCFSLRMYHDRIQPPPPTPISGPDHEKTRLGAPARQDSSGVQYERMLVGMPCDYGSPQLSSSYARSIQQTSPESPIDRTAHQRASNTSFDDMLNVANRDIRYAPRLSSKRVAILDQLDQVPWNLMSAFEPSSIIPRLSPHPSLQPPSALTETPQTCVA